MGKKLVFITTRLFWPPDSGRKASLYHYCKGLHEQLGYELYVYAFLEGGQLAEDMIPYPSFLEDVRIARPVSAFEKAKNLLLSLLDSNMPLQCAIYWSGANLNAIRSYCKEKSPDIVMIDMIRLAPYIDALDETDCARVLDYDDLLSKRYERQMGKSGGNPLGNYGAQASGLINSLMSNRAVKKAVLSIESRRTRGAEEKYARQADAVLFVSPVEAAEFNKKLGANKSLSATVGAEILEFSAALSRKEYDFGFVGNMNTAANQASLDYICSEILPLLPGKTLRVIGVCPENVQRHYSGFEQLSFSGRVDSIGAELLRCKIMLAPFVYGTGIKTKVLEAMGMGVPVVTNSIGVEGLTCKSGIDLECGEAPGELARICLTLLEDPKRRASIGSAGKEYVRQNHSWHTSIENLGRCLEFALREHAGNTREELL